MTTPHADIVSAKAVTEPDIAAFNARQSDFLRNYDRRERERREAKRKVERAALRAAGVPDVIPEVEV